MAKQVGNVPFVGTLNGINFYMRKGKSVARKAGGGFTGDAIKNSLSMVCVRENGTDFGHCSRIKSCLRTACFLFLESNGMRNYRAG